MNNIIFNAIDVNTKIKHGVTRAWLNKVAESYGAVIVDISYNFCSDEYLLEINNKHLEHDFYTDIITFDLSEKKGRIEGDIYISLDRVKDNARANKCTKPTELNRVMVHGLLHLLGFKDKSKKDQVLMREAENACLEMLNA